uniref:Serpentine receptor class gamma n=1 Tax=Steinernema glaseri TaxID=37863 RepID=A0A1I8A4L5_9BILA
MRRSRIISVMPSDVVFDEALWIMRLIVSLLGYLSLLASIVILVYIFIVIRRAVFTRQRIFSSYEMSPVVIV